MLSRFPVIVGPTAGGKTTLALDVAELLRDRHALEGEIISADAFQVYRGMDIGTAKPTEQERRGIPHHLIDIVQPTEPFSVDQWLERAESAIDDIRARGRTPIVAGGTHLYIKALLDGLFQGPEPDPELRRQLHSCDPRQLRAELERGDPDAAARIHPNDLRRTVRALEVLRLTGSPISSLQNQWDRQPRSDALLVGLDWPTEAINRRINRRVHDMIDRGLVEETRRLHEAGLLGPQAREALGYKQILAHLEGRCTLDEAIERTKIETRRFAKNQRTWLRRLRSTPHSIWIDASGGEPSDWAQIIVNTMLSE